MMGIMESPYAGWFEGFIEAALEHKPVAIAAGMILEDGSTVDGYYKCDSGNKAKAAHSIYSDAMMDVMKVNARDVVRAAEEQEDEDT